MIADTANAENAWSIDIARGDIFTLLHSESRFTTLNYSNTSVDLQFHRYPYTSYWLCTVL